MEIKHLRACATALGLAAWALVTAGCVQTKLTEPQRSAMEQLLLSTAADRAIETADLRSLSGRKVYVSTNYFEGYDAKYALGTIRDALSRSGARLVDAEKDADYIVEPRSGALSVDSANSLLGIPMTAVPVPFVGSFAIPEVALVKSEKQYSTAKLAVLAYARETGEHLLSSGPMVGRAHNHYYRFLWIIPYTSTDIPEKMKASKGK